MQLTRISKYLALTMILWGSIQLLAPKLTSAQADGFNANWVQITKLPTGLYRVNIKYTHVEIGEYREAHADFAKKEDATELYQKLVNGADFFLGDIKKSVHFHKPAEKNKPY
jgi:hypothetical protein